MSTPIHKVNKQRRQLLQGAAVSAVALAAPGIAHAVCGSGDHQLTKSTGSVNSTRSQANNEINIELIESKITLSNGALARITVTNNSKQAIRLSHLSPGAITTQSGVYQLNATLQNNPLSIRPNGVYQFWLKPDSGELAQRSGPPAYNENELSTATMLQVTVVSDTKSGSITRSHKVQAFI